VSARASRPWSGPADRPPATRGRVFSDIRDGARPRPPPVGSEPAPDLAAGAPDPFDPTMRRPSLLPVLALLSATALAACGSSSDDSASTSGGSTIAPPDPNGVLLSGDPGDPALGALVDMKPSPVPPEDVIEGLLTTRLEALLAPAVTVEEVNDALALNDAAIVSMAAGFPAVTLVVPAAADANAAQMRADALEATPAFGAVTVSYATVEPPVVMPLGGGGGGGGGAISTALEVARIVPAQNAADLLGVGGPRLSVIVADEFTELTPNPAITAQSFPDPVGSTAIGFSGNRGFFAAGVIGADEDPNSDLDIVHPRGGEKLDIRCAPMSGLSWSDRILETAFALDAAPGPVVLYTGVTYEPSENERTRGWRATDALFWRYLMASRSLTLVHVQPAGDHGLETGDLREARWCSPYALSESAMDPGAGLTGEDLEDYELALTVTGLPPQVGRLRVVGSRETDPSVGSVWSSPGADLTMVGEAVEGLCVMPQLGCQNGAYPGYSTRAAAAQVAGIYSYLWGIKPTMSSTELLDIVDNAYFSGAVPNVVDAYQAVLALDPSLGSAAVRRELLDVAAGTDVYSEIGDGIFDDHDIAVFVAALDVPVSSLIGAGNDSVFDLNGDGEIGGTGTAPFDLDVNVPPVLSNVEGFYGNEPVPFDETAVTDVEILCYYSLTNLFTGDEERRDHLLEACLPVPPGAPELGQFSLRGVVEAGLGTEFLIDDFSYTNQNTPETLSETVTLQGTASALATQSGLTIVVGSEGLERISSDGAIESHIDAVAPPNGTMLAESECELDFILEVPAGGADAELHYSYTIDANLADPNTYANGSIFIDVDVDGHNALYELDLDFDASNVPPNDTQVVPLQLPEGTVDVDLEFRGWIGNNFATTGEPVDIHLDVDWDFDFFIVNDE